MATGLSQINVRASFTTNLKQNLSRPSSRRAPTVVAVAVAVAQEESYWATIESEIESYLKKAIPIRSPESVFEPMRHLTFAAPTTTASSLCVAACELVGGHRRQAIAAAAALHLMHAALYTHEHLLLTDRPRPGPDRTIERKYGPNIELMTGDGLIPFGLELLADSMDVDENNQDKILQAIIEITRATGSQGMIGGQYRKLELDDSGNADPEIIEHVCRKKDGELHACAAVCGAILGGGAGEEIEKLRRFGLLVGMVRGLVANKGYRGMEEKIEKLKESALQEMGGFAGTTAKLISSLVYPRPAAVSVSMK